MPDWLAILAAAHPDEWRDIVDVLRDFLLLRSDVLKPGGSKGLISRKLDSHFTKLGRIEGVRHAHCRGQVGLRHADRQVDRYKNRVVLEVEWNNSTRSSTGSEYFSSVVRSTRDRCGVILTRCTELQQYSTSSEGVRALVLDDHIDYFRGLMAEAGGGCPVVVFGIRGACYVEDQRPSSSTVPGRRRKLGRHHQATPKA